MKKSIDFGDFKIRTKGGRTIKVKNLRFDQDAKYVTAEISVDVRAFFDFMGRCTDQITPIEKHRPDYPDIKNVEIMSIESALKLPILKQLIFDDGKAEIKRISKRKFLSYKSKMKIHKETEDWYRRHIDEITGFHLREDGRVEVDRDYLKRDRNEKQN